MKRMVSVSLLQYFSLCEKKKQSGKSTFGSNLAVFPFKSKLEK